MPFDRLIRAVDAWAKSRNRSDVFAQIGPNAWRPRHIPSIAFLTPEEFRARAAAATAIVAHAGMGSIITACELGKPILVMPRRGDLRETRNDHQVATARRFHALGRVAVAFDEQELSQELDRLDQLATAERISTHAARELIAELTDFINPEHDAGPRFWARMLRAITP